jgi:uncharacterized protein (TIGR02145 family)
MRYFLTSLLCVLTLSLTDQETGCTYSIANNYSSTATVDDGRCVFGGVNVFDYDNDGNIAINDFIAMRSYFGDTDSDSDGVFDSEDDCIDQTACNYQSNPTYHCYYLDVLGVCAGWCIEDADGDGICDWNCGENLIYDGYDYSTVQIGEQCWFSENCRYLPEVSPSSAGSETAPYYYVYGYEGTDVTAAQATTNYETYGVLYNWPAVMTEGICPSGWHIPSDGEWQTMEISLGMSEAEAASEGWRGTDEGLKMKDDVQWNGSNSSGFTGLPSGARYSGGFYYDGDDGYWWSASESGSFSWMRILVSYNDAVGRYSKVRNHGFSARCVRD